MKSSIASPYNQQVDRHTCERGSIAVGDLAVGDEGFAPLDSLFEGFRAIFTDVFFVFAFDCAAFPAVEAPVSASPTAREKKLRNARASLTSSRRDQDEENRTQGIQLDTPSEDVADRGRPDWPSVVVLGDTEAAAALLEPSRCRASVTLIFGRATSDMARAVP